jgi:hypothetical protein
VNVNVNMNVNEAMDVVDSVDALLGSTICRQAVPMDTYQLLIDGSNAADLAQSTSLVASQCARTSNVFDISAVAIAIMERVCV